MSVSDERSKSAKAYLLDAELGFLSRVDSGMKDL
jgi:hypothetical protein